MLCHQSLHTHLHQPQVATSSSLTSLQATQPEPTLCPTTIIVSHNNIGKHAHEFVEKIIVDLKLQ